MKIHRNLIKPHKKPSEPETTAFFKNRGPLFLGFILFSFLVNFIIYLLTLAPTVTLEDSGELICAAYNCGIPHEPGYPLFTMLGKLFTLLPFGTIAFRVNLMSAFFTALAGVFVFLSTVILIERIFASSLFWKKNPLKRIEILEYSIGLCVCMLSGLAFTSWEQAIITEVYGLNSFFTGLFIFLLLLFARQTDETKRRNIFYSISFVLGLTLTNHTTSAMFIPLFGVFLLLTDKKIFLKFDLLAKAAGMFLLGLLPLIYLPLAARRNPIINWGDPENITNFIRVITRRQYGQNQRTLEGFLSQFWVFINELLTEQWFPVFLLFAIAGMMIIYKKDKPFFYFALSFLFFSMPVMTFMTNFDVATPSTAFEHKALVSVFYIPAYLFLSILMGVGFFYMISFLPSNGFTTAIAAIFLPIIIFIGSGIRNFSNITMHNYFCAQQYANNIFRTLPKNSLLLVHWDPFSFPLIYYQYVEHKRPDLLVLDQMLLKRSWYLQWLKRNYPEFAKRCDREINEFLSAVVPFENNAPYNGDMIQRKYIAMIDAFVDTTLASDRGVYCTYTPERAITRGYRLETILSAYKFTKGPQLDTAFNETACDVSAFTDKSFSHERMKNYLKEYYGNAFGMRAMDYELRGNADRARYCYGIAGQLFPDSSQRELFIKERLRQLGR